MYQELLDATIPDDPYYSSDLTNYFPARMHESYGDEIQSHPLRREIIATTITNSIINRLGSTAFFHIREDTGMSSCDIARCYTITREVYDLRDIWYEIEALDGKVDSKIQMELFIEIRNLIERVILWFLRRNKHPISISEAINNYILGIRALSECLDTILPETPLTVLQKRYKKYKKHNVPDSLAKKIAGFEAMSSACDIVEVARQASLPVNVVGKVYFELGAVLELGWMRRKLYKVNITSYWQRLSMNTLVDDLFDQQRRLTSEVIKLLCKDGKCEDAFELWHKETAAQIARYDDFVQDLKSQDDVGFSTMVVAVKKVKEICAI
jgi:glutamate dehydrogenase